VASEDSFTAEEISELRKLLDVAKIKKVKDLYSQLMDGRDFDRLANIYAEDAVGEWGAFGTWHGRKEIHAAMVSSYEGQIPYDGLHCTTNMWVELTGETTAISRTYLHDVLNEANPRTNPVIWFAIYDEDWEKIAGEWKIKRSQIHFLWPERHVHEGFPRLMPVTAIG
jgi:hypothetical protein